MKGFVKEFKAFAFKGNVMDLAVAVVIGTAFGKIVSSLVANVITPIIGQLLGGVNFSGLRYTIGEATVTYGVFIQSIFDFLVVALVIFMVIRVSNKAQEMMKEEEVKKEEEKKVAEPSEEVKLLREIRDSLQK